MKFFTLYWLAGNKQFVAGDSIEHAFTRAGYSGGALKGLDFYKEGFDFNYYWAKPALTGEVKHGSWVQVSPSLKDPQYVPVHDMVVNDTMIKPFQFMAVLKEAERYGGVTPDVVPGCGPSVSLLDHYAAGGVLIKVSDLPALWQARL